ncbi:hypothetical protein M231_05051 [Tremella mesenterica]|uniref:Uncharacterized protein n=1 Tax=Tremella mesenterica TaxID=5217 RepID=A0A4Q1BIX4_TREME|nr:hypothetical protein M231_05051 [Tremella mesenterica]
MGDSITDSTNPFVDPFTPDNERRVTNLFGMYVAAQTNHSNFQLTTTSFPPREGTGDLLKDTLSTYTGSNTEVLTLRNQHDFLEAEDLVKCLEGVWAENDTRWDPIKETMSWIRSLIDPNTVNSKIAKSKLYDAIVLSRELRGHLYGVPSNRGTSAEAAIEAVVKVRQELYGLPSEAYDLGDKGRFIQQWIRSELSKATASSLGLVSAGVGAGTTRTEPASQFIARELFSIICGERNDYSKIAHYGCVYAVFMSAAVVALTILYFRSTHCTTNTTVSVVPVRSE